MIKDTQQNITRENHMHLRFELMVGVMLNVGRLEVVGLILVVGAEEVVGLLLEVGCVEVEGRELSDGAEDTLGLRELAVYRMK